MDVIGWLTDADPGIRWQVRDLLDAPQAEIDAERARVAREGWGARLLALQLGTGQWPSAEPEFRSPQAREWWRALPAECRGTLFPEWTSTCWSLVLLRELGLPPSSPEARRAVSLVRQHCRWEHDQEPFFEGEVEPCINGRTVALGAYFGEDVEAIVDRLLGEQMEDGGWNCEQENGATVGSFHSTIEVLTGLLEFERVAPRPERIREARLRGQEYLLERRLFRRRSTGEVIDPGWTRFAFPAYWHYDVLRGLDYLRAAGAAADDRVGEAIELVRSKRDAEGRWALEHRHEGDVHFEVDEGVGHASRWNTLRALRVLRWAEAG